MRGRFVQSHWKLKTAQAIEAELAAQVAPLLPGSTEIQSVSATVASEVTRAAFVTVGCSGRYHFDLYHGGIPTGTKSVSIWCLCCGGDGA